MTSHMKVQAIAFALSSYLEMVILLQDIRQCDVFST